MNVTARLEFELGHFLHFSHYTTESRSVMGIASWGRRNTRLHKKSRHAIIHLLFYSLCSVPGIRYWNPTTGCWLVPYLRYPFLRGVLTLLQIKKRWLHSLQRFKWCAKRNGYRRWKMRLEIRIYVLDEAVFPFTRTNVLRRDLILFLPSTPPMGIIYLQTPTRKQDVTQGHFKGSLIGLHVEFS